MTQHLVRMVRGAGVAKGGPTTADVHPAEIENYRAGGWHLPGEPAPRPQIETAPATSSPSRRRLASVAYKPREKYHLEGGA